MIRYELKKFLRSGMLWAVAALFLVLTAYWYFPRESLRDEEVSRLYEQAGTVLTKELYDAVSDANSRGQAGEASVRIAGIEGEYHPNMVLGLYYNIQGLLEMEERRLFAIQQADYNIAEYEANPEGNEYKLRYNRLIRQVYSERKTPYLMDASPWVLLFERLGQPSAYHLAEAFALCLAILGAVYLFTADRAAGVYPIVHSSRRGRSPAYWARAAAALLYAAAAMAVFFAATVACFAIQTDLTCWLAPVQSLYLFEHCPLNISIAGMLALHLAFRLAVAVFMAAFAIFVSCLARGRLLSLGLGLAGLGGLLGSSLYVALGGREDVFHPNPSYTEIRFEQFFRSWNPLCLLDTQDYLTGMDVADIAGWPVFRFVLPLLVCLAGLAAFLLLGWRLFLGGSCRAPRRAGAKA
ncbi:MAG TPA: hypothetical protein H9674_08145 [Firmicutes bacterium]|nr:hypothetical protein [Bacillota bacterium]